jgi:hypothetical protein
MTTSTTQIQISVGAFLVLISLIPPPRKPGIYELRRRAAYAGIRSVRRGDRRIAVKYARRSELLSALDLTD